MERTWGFRSHPIGGGAADILQYNGLICRDGNCRDRRLLFASALGEGSCSYRNAASRRRFARAVCLVAHPASHCCRSGLRRLWRGLCRHRRCLALAHRRRASDRLGPARISGRRSRHGDHRASPEGVKGPRPYQEARPTGCGSLNETYVSPEGLTEAVYQSQEATARHSRRRPPRCRMPLPAGARRENIRRRGWTPYHQ